MPTEVVMDEVHFETIDINVIPDLYVTWIVDIWKGDRHDPAVTISRYIGVWDAADLEDEQGFARDPDFTDFSDSYYGKRQIKPQPIHWHELAIVKEGDRDAITFKKQHDELVDEEPKYRYGRDSQREKLYKDFMHAIDVLGENPNDPEAWETVAAWRQYNAEKHEK